MAQKQDKHCTSCGRCFYTSLYTCPKCGGDLADD